MKIFLDKHAPITNAIMGAVMSGGDAKALAQQMHEQQQQRKAQEAVEAETQANAKCGSEIKWRRNCYCQKCMKAAHKNRWRK